MDDNSLPVVSVDKCTACGDCVEVCPKDLFSIQPLSHRLWVNCKNLEHGDDILEECQVGCTACGKCAMDAGGDLTEAYYVDQSPYAHLDTYEELATKNAGRVYEQMEFE